MYNTYSNKNIPSYKYSIQIQSNIFVINYSLIFLLCLILIFLFDQVMVSDGYLAKLYNN